jgi:hypothetical protein
MKPPAIPDVIAPVDVLRLMLAARYRRKTALKFAEQINSYPWFWFPTSAHIKVRKGRIRKLAKIPLAVHAAAVEMEKLLRRHIREGSIRLRGDLKAGDPPLDIDPAHCQIGELDIFQQTLTISVLGRRTPACVYRNMFCVADGAMDIVNEISKNHTRSVKGVLSFETLKQASEATIRDTIKSIYDDADKGGSRPNIVDLPDAVLPRLKNQGLTASKSQIRKIGGKDFEGRRNKRGKRLT